MDIETLATKLIAKVVANHKDEYLNNEDLTLDQILQDTSEVLMDVLDNLFTQVPTDGSDTDDFYNEKLKELISYSEE